MQYNNETHELTKQPHQFLQRSLISLDGFECLAGAEESLNRSQEHHPDHHDGENRNGIAGHPHNEHIHGNLQQKAKWQFENTG